MGACGGAVEITWALPEGKELKFVPAAIAAVAYYVLGTLLGPSHVFSQVIS